MDVRRRPCCETIETAARRCEWRRAASWCAKVSTAWCFMLPRPLQMGFDVGRKASRGDAGSDRVIMEMFCITRTGSWEGCML